jgi:hypothetical protein
MVPTLISILLLNYRRTHSQLEPGVNEKGSKSSVKRAGQAQAAVINKGSNLPCSFAAQLRCSLVEVHCGYAPRSRLAGRQNPGGILPPLFITAA